MAIFYRNMKCIYTAVIDDRNHLLICDVVLSKRSRLIYSD